MKPHRPSPRPRTRSRRLLAVGAALLVAGVVTVTAPVVALGAQAGPAVPAGPAAAPVPAGTGSTTVTGPSGQKLTVTPTTGLDPAGETITVTGTGYAIPGFDLAIEGLYLGLCVDRGPGLSPSPCIGGVDMTGASPTSRWITNNPLPGADVVPLAADGSFTTTITIPRADEYVDCGNLPAGQACKVITRMDHRWSGDRSQDVKVPVTFASGPVTPSAAITVAPSTGLDPAGASVVVSGTGYPTTADIDVAFGPAAGDPVDPAVFGAVVRVPKASIAPNGSWSVTLDGIVAAYTDGHGTDRDLSAGGGRISTYRADGAADPDGRWRASRPVSFAGAPAATTQTGLAVAPSSVSAGTPVVMTALVTTIGAVSTSASSDGAGAEAPVAPQAAVSAGTVEFSDGGTVLGTATVGPDGKATRTATLTQVGTHTLTARFTGTDEAAASTSPPVTVTVTPAAPPTTRPDPGPAPDEAPSGSRTGTGVNGQTVTATPVDNLDPAGTLVTVEGRGFTAAAGFDIATEGMYLGFCVDQGPGVQPSPCVGGVDTEGSSGTSKWVGNNPYEGVPASATTPVRPDGSWSTAITVQARDEFVDCLALTGGKRCVIVTRMDHRASADRSQDVKVPVCFAGEPACATDPIAVSETPGDDVFRGYALNPDATPGGVNGNLARTGFEGRTLVPLGLGLLGLGAALVAVAQRPARLDALLAAVPAARRRRPHPTTDPDDRT